MTMSALRSGSSPLAVRPKLALGAVAATVVAWSIGPAQAVTYNVVNIVDPLNPTFTQALGINDASTIVGYGNATVFNGFQLVLPPVPANFARQNVPGADGGTQVVGISGAGTTRRFLHHNGSHERLRAERRDVYNRRSTGYRFQPAAWHQQVGHDRSRIFLRYAGWRYSPEGVYGIGRSDFH